MIPGRFTCLWLASLALPFIAASDPSPVLVEVFASKNCGASQKAHRTLRDVVAERDDAFILTWSVDYWDYLGEPDPRALPEAKLRQSAYVERFGNRGPYTPQLVYDGARETPAKSADEVETLIALREVDHRETGIAITALETGFRVTGETAEPLDMHLIEFQPGTGTDGMINPVTAARRLGSWTGGDVTMTADCETGCAVLLQGPNYGEVRAVQRIH